MNRVEVSTYICRIFIAGDYEQAVKSCRDYCDKIGLCVTISKTKYVYTRGEEDGIEIGFINYGRFPNTPGNIFELAENLAKFLLVELNQQSVSIVGLDKTIWLSNREEDN